MHYKRPKIKVHFFFSRRGCQKKFPRFGAIEKDKSVDSNVSMEVVSNITAALMFCNNTVKPDKGDQVLLGPLGPDEPWGANLTPDASRVILFSTCSQTVSCTRGPAAGLGHGQLDTPAMSQQIWSCVSSLFDSISRGSRVRARTPTRRTHTCTPHARTHARSVAEIWSRLSADPEQPG